jgi:hypothetical protein
MPDEEIYTFLLDMSNNDSKEGSAMASPLQFIS